MSTGYAVVMTDGMQFPPNTWGRPQGSGPPPYQKQRYASAIMMFCKIELGPSPETPAVDGVWPRPQPGQTSSASCAARDSLAATRRMRPNRAGCVTATDGACGLPSTAGWSSGSSPGS